MELATRGMAGGSGMFGAQGAVAVDSALHHVSPKSTSC